MARPLLPALFLLALLPATNLHAAECKLEDPTNYGSSFTAWIEATAVALETRAAEWNVSKVQIDVLPGIGIDPLKGKRVFTRRLESRLRGGQQLQIASGGAIVTVRLSLETGDFWALGSLEAPSIPGGAAVATFCPQDRELASLMGSRPRHAGQGRWSLSPLGAVHSDVLDLLLLDINRDGQDDIVLLGTDGLLALGYEAGDGRPVVIAGPAPLPPGKKWPAIVAGWLAESPEGRAILATSAGHSLEWGGGRLLQRSDIGPLIVPLRGFSDGDVEPEIPAGMALEAGGPALSASHLGPPIPSPVRALHPVPGRPGSWAWVREDGILGLSGWDEAGASLPSGLVGDDLLIVDLDGETGPELVTTGAGGPGDSDSLTIHRLRPGLASGVLFSETWSGSILGIAEGDLDFDGLPDLVIAEELAPGRAQLWHLERSR